MARLSKEERARKRRIRHRNPNARQRELLRALAIVQDADCDDTSFLVGAGLVEAQWEGPPTLNIGGREFLLAIDSK